ncbi:MAG: hypothetical protein ACFCUR_13315 [Rhodomicrobiaceae bacterium]
MKRCLYLLVLSLTLILGGLNSASAVPYAALELAVLDDGPLLLDADDKKEGRKRLGSGNRKERGGKLREGVGAGFWGGPYWGYGPRWGHRCETCKSNCDEDNGSRACKKCRIRCGW